MAVTFYPAILSPYPSDSLLAARRVDPQHYPKWDGWCLKLGPLGCSVNWRRR
jgi:hypothetical protein